MMDEKKGAKLKHCFQGMGPILCPNLSLEAEYLLQRPAGPFAFTWGT